MEILHRIAKIHADLCRYVSDPPSLVWIFPQILQILKTFPSGLTYDLLLHELEASWWKCKGYDENISPLQKAMKNKSSLDEVIYGTLQPLENSSTFLLLDESNTSIEFIINRQFHDFEAYLQHMGFPLFQMSSREISISQCQLIHMIQRKILLGSSNSKSSNLHSTT